MKNTKPPIFYTSALITLVVVIFVSAFFVLSNTLFKTSNASQTNSPITTDNVVQIPKPTLADAHSNSVSNNGVPILMYHYIRIVDPITDKLGYNLSVTPANFEQQIKWLSNQGYKTITLNSYCENSKIIPNKSIILTFDDGYNDAYSNAMLILTKYNYIGTFFIIKSKIDKPNYLTQNQINNMSANGMEIGSHTVSHPNLSSSSTDKQRSELLESKQTSPVLAYPSGKYNQITLQLSKEAGYICAVTTNSGVANSNSPLFELPRVRISGSTALEAFKKSILTDKGL
jgi:peptidoglycan/xylan/chitin deacetylase (PgdA/CDA1 family)